MRQESRYQYHKQIEPLDFQEPTIINTIFEKYYLCKMSRKIELTAIIEKEGNTYVSFCPELDIASQGKTSSVAKKNLIEAIELFYETASEAEILKRLESDLQISRVIVNVE